MKQQLPRLPLPPVQELEDKVKKTKREKVNNCHCQLWLPINYIIRAFFYGGETCGKLFVIQSAFLCRILIISVSFSRPVFSCVFVPAIVNINKIKCTLQGLKRSKKEPSWQPLTHLPTTDTHTHTSPHTLTDWHTHTHAHAKYLSLAVKVTISFNTYAASLVSSFHKWKLNTILRHTHTERRMGR